MSASATRRARAAGFALGIDADPALLVHDSLAEGVINTVATHHPTLVLIMQRHVSIAPALGSVGEAVAASITAPVAIVIGNATTIADVRLFESESSERHHDEAAISLAEELASRIGRRSFTRHHASELPQPDDLRPGQVCVAADDLVGGARERATHPTERRWYSFSRPPFSPAPPVAADAELRLR